MRLIALAALATALAVLAPYAQASPPFSGPDLPSATPVLRHGPATRTASISATGLCGRLRALARRGGSRTGLFVLDDSADRVVCRRASRTRRSLASNMKLFTTATALARFGPDDRIPTRLFRLGALDGATLHGSLYLVGGGDPALGSPAFYDRYYAGLGTDLYALARYVREAGIRRVTGRVYADESMFDALRGVADSGYATSPYIGPLSALSFNTGFSAPRPGAFSSNPARLAAVKLARVLSRRGVRVTERVAVRPLPDGPGPRELGRVLSPRMSRLVDATDVYSNNFFAEMLIKRLGARFRSRGSTAAGASVVERFAADHGSGVHAIDGSGLTRGNRASPAEVGRLLQAMRAGYAGDRFAGALALAGREGTVADRMRGTPAEGRCRVKTGTIIAVSALSGYCFNRSGKTMVFSVLMNGVWDLDRARRAQDRIAALVARY